MPREITLVAVLSEELSKTFYQKKQYRNIDHLPNIHPRVKQAVREYIQDNVGYEIDTPIATLSRYNNYPGGLDTIGLSVSEFLHTKVGSTLWELVMPEDMAVSIDFQILQQYSIEAERMIKMGADEEMLSDLLEEFKECMVIGYSDASDVISFIPFIDYSRCKFYSFIDSSWNIGSFNAPGVQLKKLSQMDMF